MYQCWLWMTVLVKVVDSRRSSPPYSPSPPPSLSLPPSLSPLPLSLPPPLSLSLSLPPSSPPRAQELQAGARGGVPAPLLHLQQQEGGELCAGEGAGAREGKGDPGAQRL